MPLLAKGTSGAMAAANRSNAQKSHRTHLGPRQRRLSEKCREALEPRRSVASSIS